VTLPALVALALTLAVEVPLVATVTRLAAWTTSGRAVAGAVGANLVTHPVLYAVSTGFASPWQLVAAETVVVGVETVLLLWWWRVRGREDATTLALTVVAANAASTALGLLVL
jgi:hypothetical protein